MKSSCWSSTGLNYIQSIFTQFLRAFHLNLSLGLNTADLSQSLTANKAHLWITHTAWLEHTVLSISALLLLYDITRKASFDNIRVRQTNIWDISKCVHLRFSFPCFFFVSVGCEETFPLQMCFLSFKACVCCCCMSIAMQAWLTEIYEYAQKDVVIMLLGNKVSGTSWKEWTEISRPSWNAQIMF